MYLNYPKEAVSAFKVKGYTKPSLFLHSRKSSPWLTAFFEHHVSCDLFLNGDSVSSSRGLPFQFLFSSSPPLFLCFNCWGLNPRSHVKWGLPLSYNLAKHCTSLLDADTETDLHDITRHLHRLFRYWCHKTGSSALHLFPLDSSLRAGHLSLSATVQLCSWLSPVLSLEWHVLEMVNTTCSVYSSTSLVSCCPWDKAQIP